MYGFAALLCTATTQLSGNALTLATAAVRAYFTITARDEFQNEQIEQVPFKVLLRQAKVMEKNEPGTITHLNGGRYQASFVPPRSGTAEVKVLYSPVGGLTASYYGAASDGSVQHDPNVSLAALEDSSAASFVGQWAGFVSPLSKNTFTFFAKLHDADERVRLWLDNAVIIDSWSSLTSLNPSAAIHFASLDPSELLLDYRNPQGQYSLQLQWAGPTTGGRTIVPSSSLSGARHVGGSPFALPIRVGHACAATSLLSSPTGLGLATAGVAAVLQIVARDAFGDECTKSSIVSARLEGPARVKVSTLAHENSVHSEFIATKSGTYETIVGIYKHGGLLGCYYDNIDMTGNPTLSRIDPTVSFKWGPGASVTPHGSEFVSIRWRGMLDPQTSEEYTLFWQVTSSSSARLWIDGVQLASVDSSTVGPRKILDEQMQEVLLDGAQDFDSKLIQATVGLVHSVMRDIELEWTATFGAVQSKLMWSSRSLPREVIPSDRMTHPLSSLRADASTVVVPGVACGTASTVDSAIPTVIEPGAQLMLNIQARDQFGNARSEGGDVFVTHLSGKYAGVASDQLNGKYISHIDTRVAAGRQGLHIGLRQAVGVQAIFKSVDATSVQNRLILTHAEQPSVNGLDCCAQNYHATWMGYVYVSCAGTYSLFTRYSPTAAAAQVVIDGTVVLSIEGSWSTLIPITSGFHTLTVSYTSSSPDEGVSLEWESKSCGIERRTLSGNDLWHTVDLSRSPFEMIVLTSPFCGGHSKVAGHGFSLATAGSTAMFTVHSRDVHNNILDGPQTGMVVAYLSDESGAATRNSQTTVQRIAAGEYSVAYKQTSTKKTELHIGGILQSGVLAKYFANRKISGDVKLAHESMIAISGDTMDAPAGLPASPRTGREFSVRWHGLIRIFSAEVYTFSASVKEADERVRLWIDNSLVVDQWSSLTSTGEFHGTIGLTERNAVYEVRMEYSQQVGVYATALKWSSGFTGPSVPIPSGSLLGFSEMGPFALIIHPAPFCAVTSQAYGAQLTIASAATRSHFSISSKDEFGNLRARATTDFFVVSLVPPLQRGVVTSAPSIDAAGIIEGKHVVWYTPAMKGTTSMHISGAVQPGLTGVYHRGKTLTHPVVQQHDPSIDFHWGKSAPSHEFIPSDFSVVWNGYIRPSLTAMYSFALRTDGCAMLLIDSEIAIDMWASTNEGNRLVESAKMELQAEAMYAVTIKYKTCQPSMLAETFHNGLIWQWARENEKLTIVPWRTETKPPFSVLPAGILTSSPISLKGSPFTLRIH